jgi:hypothetical protein
MTTVSLIDVGRNRPGEPVGTGWVAQRWRAA